MTLEFLVEGLFFLVPLVLSLTVHEFAHAWSAYRLGDDTASRMGRMTLNPLAHIDPIGTLLLPMLRIPFGWAKPVPVNPARFSRNISMRKGMMITAAAGPISNVLLALLCSLIWGMLIRWVPEMVVGQNAVGYLLWVVIKINVALAVFNLLPVPPLDGSRIVDGIIPQQFRGAWESFSKYSFVVLLVVIYFGDHITKGPIEALRGVFINIVNAIAF